MNIFVLSTGRCGSTTFIKACQHITNYSSEHESRTGLVGAERLNYPEHHIESDNRLSWFIGALDNKYGTRAFYVHLTRDREPTVASLSKRKDAGLILNAFHHGILLGVPDNTPPQELGQFLYDTVNSNIELFLKDKPHKMSLRLEHAKSDFQEFWHAIGAEGDLEAALQEWDVLYNASYALPDKRDGVVSHCKTFIRRFLLGSDVTE